jgi:hypothetical protein
MPLHIQDAPDEIRTGLLRKLELAWRWPGQEPPTEEEARGRVDSSVGYTLAMFWQGRTDKIEHGDGPIYAWMTENGLPAELVERERRRSGMQPVYGTIMFKNANHHELQRQVMDALWADYRTLPDTGLPQDEQPRSLFSRLFR